MAYATLDDLTLRFGETEILRNAAEDGQVDGPVNTTRVATLLNAATAVVDSYLGRRYQTPLSPVPDVVVDATCALARYALASGGQSTPSDQMRDGRRDAMAWLKSIAEGTATLPDADPIASASSFAQTQDRPGLYDPRLGRGLR